MLMPPALGRIPLMETHPALIGLIPLGMIVGLLVFDLFTRRGPLAVTLIGRLSFVAANPIMAAVVHTPFAERITLWAQQHP